MCIPSTTWHVSCIMYCTVLYDRVNWLYGVKKISIKWLWPVKVTLKVNKRFLKAFRCSCEEGPLRKAYLFLGLKNLLLHIAQQITKQSKNPGPRANQVTKLTPFSLWCVNALNGSIWSTEPPAPENPAPTPPPPHQYPPPTNFWDDIQLICFIEN